MALLYLNISALVIFPELTSSISSNIRFPALGNVGPRDPVAGYFNDGNQENVVPSKSSDTSMNLIFSKNPRRIREDVFFEPRYLNSSILKRETNLSGNIMKDRRQFETACALIFYT